MNSPDTVEVVKALSMQLSVTPHDYALDDLCKEIEIGAIPLYGGMTT